MKVNIQYAVDLEDIPREVAKLLPKHLDLTAEKSGIEDMLLEGNIINSIEMISQLRKVLYNTDRRLQDCDALLKGFLEVRAKPEQPPEPTAEEEEDDTTS
tara:strand:+ start:557 stop:856 length:300 start_codon:yes stop_codon:yes gene_type:complete